MNELALFAGAGGGLLATKWLLNWRSVCYVEKDSYCVEVLKARIRDGYLDDAPIWDDVRTFDGRPWTGLVDVVSGGFPCQPFAEGGKRKGQDDSRNAWPDTIRIINEVKPGWVFLENTTKLLSPFRTKGIPAYFNAILKDLAASGYYTKWGCLSAYSLGASHKRRRVWIVAHARLPGRQLILCNHSGKRTKTIKHNGTVRPPNALDAVFNHISQLEERLGEPSVFGTNDGMAHRMDRLGAIGQGQVPIVAATAWRLLTEEL